MMACTTYSCQVTSSTPRPAASADADAHADATGAPREESGRTKLTKSAVVNQALALADATGLDALTIRKLAQELGVTPMALYWHFHGKDELLEGLADRVWSEIDVDVDPEAPWPDQLRTIVESLVRVLRAHPSAPGLLMHSNKQGKAELRAIEVALEVLRSAGFDPPQASEIARSGLWTGIMLVMSEPGEPVLASLSAEERAELQRKKQIVLATLPVAQYPRLVECAASLTACDDPDFHYDFGINLFISGVEAMSAALPGQDSTR
jgi:AcrR family transcriptional regulator